MMNRMKRKKQKFPIRGKQSRPLVGIAVDGAMGHGRSLMRGVMRFANARRRWLLHEELRAVFPEGIPWPKCDGAIHAGGNPKMLAEIHRRSRHLVLCTGNADTSQTPVVCADDHAVGAMAASHLLDCNLEHFGFYGRLHEPVSAGRHAGFAEALAQRGKTCEVSPVSWPDVYEWINKTHWPALRKWLENLPKPVGIFAWDDMAAHDLAAACFQAGIGVPDRVAILGVNNDDLLCDSAWPPLSSVEVDFVRVGFLAGQMLEMLLSGETISKKNRVVRVAPKGVVRRQSTDVLAVKDAFLADAIRYIRNHACDPCTVRDVLKHVPVGRRWLERHLIETLGRTPHDEIIRVRLATAQRLLQHPEESIPHVADICGFSAVPNMTRTFQQVLGTTPGAFRRKHLWELRSS
jgi:LacI family transcriptional regulator